MGVSLYLTERANQGNFPTEQIARRAALLAADEYAAEMRREGHPACVTVGDRWVSVTVGAFREEMWGVASREWRWE